MAAKLHKKKEEDSVFYVGMKDPIEVRRSILESSKEMLQYLQRAEKFKDIRKQKSAQISKLKEDMHEISKLVRKLKASLPKTGLRATPPKPIIKKVPKKKNNSKKKAKKEVEVPVEIQTEIPIEKPTELSELEKLEAELGEIEGRLTKLS